MNWCVVEIFGCIFILCGPSAECSTEVESNDKFVDANFLKDDFVFEGYESLKRDLYRD